LISLAAFEEQKSNTAPEGVSIELRINVVVKRDSRRGATAQRKRSKMVADQNSAIQTRSEIR